MAQIVINTGNIANDGTGDPLRTAFNDVNTNFTQVFNAGPVNSNIRIANNSIQTTNTNGNLVLATNGVGVVVLATNFVPDIANVRMIGTATKRFNTVYTQYLDALTSTISGNLNVQGNLQVTGNIVTVNYSTANIANLTMILAGNAISASTANGAGILVNQANANLTYNYSANTWNSTISITAPGFIGDGSQLTNVTANTQAQNLQGNTINPNVIYSNLTTFGTVESIQATGDISTTGNVYANVITGTIVTANIFVGEGGNISNINASAIVGNVTSAVNAQNALTANLAALATQSINADTALFAINAGIAATANTATSALTANAASYAVQSDNANSAVVAGMAYELSPAANLSITGNIYVGGILTDGYYYANGTPFSGGGNANTGNIRFINDTIYDLYGIHLNNSDLSHGATAQLIIPPNGNTTTPAQLVNTYGDIVLTSGPDAGNTVNWNFDSDGVVNLPAGQSYSYQADLIGGGSGAQIQFQLDSDLSGTATQWLAGITAPGTGYAPGDQFTFGPAFLRIPNASVTITVIAIDGFGGITDIGFTPPPLYPTSLYRQDGFIALQADTSRWTFGLNGNLTLPSNTSSINYANGTPYGSGVVGPDISVTGNIVADGSISANTILVGGTPFTRTLTVGTAVTPVTVPLASNNSFNVGTAGGNVVVYTT